MEMAERRKARTRASSHREPSERDESLEDEELLDVDESDDDLRDGDEQDEAGRDEAPDNGHRGRGRHDDRAMTAGDAADAALRQIATLTSKEPEGVTVIERTEDGWTVGVELVEDHRIPSSGDILATYETTIDADGELVSYRRVKRYARGRGDEDR